MLLSYYDKHYTHMLLYHNLNYLNLPVLHMYYQLLFLHYLMQNKIYHQKLFVLLYQYYY